MCCRLLFLPFLLVRGILSFVGNKVSIKTGVTLITVLRLVISGFVQTSESGSLGTFELKSKDTCSTVIFWQTRKLDSEDLGACPCIVSGFIPALSKWEMTPDGFTVVSLSSGIQWIKMEEQNFHYSGLIQGSIDSGENSEENNNLRPFSNIVDFLKNNFWSLLALLVLFLDRMIWQTLDIVIGFVVIMFIGLGIIGIVESGLPATPNLWFQFPVLMFLIAYTLVLFSLILKCTQTREWLSHFTAGVAYTSATLGLLGTRVSSLTMEYVWVCVLILLYLLVLFVLHGYAPNEAY